MQIFLKKSDFILSSYLLFRLFKFLRRPNRRLMDFIVDVQRSIGTSVLSLAMIFFAFVICSKEAKKYVGHIGCYLGVYLFYFMIPYSQGHSFFNSLIRYICIIHPDKLIKRNISTEVRKNFEKVFLSSFFGTFQKNLGKFSQKFWNDFFET